MTENRLTVLRREDLDALALTWDEIIEVLGAAFTQKAASQVQNPPKPRVAPREDAFANAMPAYLSGSDRLGLKWVSGYQGNPTVGHPYIYGSLMMNDAATGRPMALIDGSWVTEMRTAAVSGLVMRHVEGARTVAMVGCGTQGRRHAELAMEALPDLDLVRAYDRVPAAVDRLTEVVGGRPVHRATSPQDAVEGADLVISSLDRAASQQAGRRRHLVICCLPAHRLRRRRERPGRSRSLALPRRRQNPVRVCTHAGIPRFPRARR